MHPAAATGVGIGACPTAPSQLADKSSYPTKIRMLLPVGAFAVAKKRWLSSSDSCRWLGGTHDAKVAIHLPLEVDGGRVSGDQWRQLRILI